MADNSEELRKTTDAIREMPGVDANVSRALATIAEQTENLGTAKTFELGLKRMTERDDPMGASMIAGAIISAVGMSSDPEAFGNQIHAITEGYIKDPRTVTAFLRTLKEIKGNAGQTIATEKFDEVQNSLQPALVNGLMEAAYKGGPVLS